MRRPKTQLGLLLELAAVTSTSTGNLDARKGIGWLRWMPRQDKIKERKNICSLDLIENVRQKLKLCKKVLREGKRKKNSSYIRKWAVHHQNPLLVSKKKVD